MAKTKKIQRREPVREDVRFARRDQLPFDVEVLRLEELLQRSMGHDLTKPQRIHFHAILLVEEGSSSHRIDFESYPAGPGDLFIIPAKHVQAFAAERDLQGYAVLFTPHFLADCELNIGELADASRILLSATPLIQLGAVSYPRVKDAIRMLAELSRIPPARFSDQQIAGSFSLLMFTLAGLPEVTASIATHEPRDALVARFLHRLEDDFVSEHNALHYAKALHVSLRTLDRHLAETRSQTTRQAISARLVLEAKRLLTRREMLIKNIAHDLGFSEPQNFTRFFRRQTGCSPESFRRMLEDSM